jgi:16S rRNA (cytosine967-C5)-methyltransferase
MPSDTTAAEKQLALLIQFAALVRPGGRLIYSVCTITRSETTAVVEAFSAAHPELAPLPLSALNTTQSSLLLLPHELNANGMFIASWIRKS